MESRGRKRELRAAIRASRARRSPQEREEAAVALVSSALTCSRVTQATTVAAYVPLVGEPDVGRLISALASRGATVLLPRIAATPDGEPSLTFAAWDPSATAAELRRGRPSPWGVRVPEPEGPDVDPGRCELLLVPALAVDTDGARLGQGGGYYDRCLAGLRDAGTDAAAEEPPLFMGVVHDEELLPPGAVPVAGHDVRMDAVLTPGGVRLIRSAAAG